MAMIFQLFKMEAIKSLKKVTGRCLKVTLKIQKISLRKFSCRIINGGRKMMIYIWKIRGQNYLNRTNNMLNRSKKLKFVKM